MPFQFLHRADPAQLRVVHRRRAPAGDRAGARAHDRRTRRRCCCPGSPPSMQAEVAHRIAVMDRTSPGDHQRRRGDPRAQALLDAAAGGDVARRRPRPAGQHHQPLRPLHRAADRRGPRGARRRRSPTRSAAGCSCSRTSSASRTAPCSWCCARSTPAELALALKGVADAVRDKITSQPLRARRREPARGGRAARHRPPRARSRRPSRTIIRDDPPARGAGPDHGAPRQR